jgi:hypothetical protein
MALNWIDKAIEAVAPTLAEERAIARHNIGVYNYWKQQGYDAGQESRRRANANIERRPEDYITAGTYDQIIANLFNLYRNDPMTKSIVDVIPTYMGESRPLASTNDPDFNEEATSYFNDVFWNMADARRRPGVDYGTLQTLWTKYSYLGGDMLFAIMGESLFPYEGLQIQTPAKLRADKQITNGIRVDGKATNRITHYYITDGEAHGNYSRLPENAGFFAPSKYWRPCMLRAAPELHSVVGALQDYGETGANVQSKIKFESMLFTIERKGAVSSGAGSRLVSRGGTGEQVEHSDTDYGLRFQTSGNPDQDFKLSNMNNPGSQHVPYMEHAGRVIGAGVGLPYEAIMHLYTNGSYTANRAARADLMQYLVDRWQWRNKVLNQRVYNWVTARAINRGDIRPAPVVNGRSTWNKATWSLPHLRQIDEGKEIIADVKKWGACQDSLGDWGRESGRTRDQLLDAHDGDIAEMKRRADGLGVTLSEYAGQLFKASAAPDQKNGDDNA